MLCFFFLSTRCQSRLGHQNVFHFHIIEPYCDKGEQCFKISKFRSVFTERNYCEVSMLIPESMSERSISSDCTPMLLLKAFLHEEPLTSKSKSTGSNGELYSPYLGTNR